MRKAFTITTAVLLSPTALAAAATDRVEVNAGVHVFAEALTTLGPEEIELVGDNEELALSIGGTFIYRQ